MKETEAWLSKIADIAAVDYSRDLPLADIKADYVVVFGGDGSIIGAARRLTGRPIPVVGINFGTFGYLAAFERSETRECLECIVRGELAPSRRMLLECQVKRSGSPIGRWLCVNEAAVTAPTHTRMIELLLTIAGCPATRYRGDGVLIATPLGTTAYNLSAGGPVLNPRLEAMTITPLCPHLLTLRSLVVPAEEKVSVNVFGPDEASLLVDGRIVHRVMPEEELNVTRAPEYFLLMESPKRSYYQTLHLKLNWGERPRYAQS